MEQKKTVAQYGRKPGSLQYNTENVDYETSCIKQL